MISVFLSPNFPPNFAHFASRLRAAGVCVLGLSDDPWHVLSDELKSSLNEYYQVSDMHNYDELVRALGYFTHRYGKIDHLDSHNEYWLETEARLRTDFNIEGIKLDSIEKIKRKSQMKKLFIEAGLKPARGRICNTEREMREFIKEVGYPVVAKPDSGVGAAKTFKLCSDGDIAAYVREKLPCDYIVEEFIDAQIVTYDGLVDKEGKVIFVSSLRYSRGVMETVNEDSDIYYYTVRDIEPKLEEAGMATLRAFNVHGRFFHFEFFVTAKGEVIPLEVNMRPPGGLTLDMINFTFDFDCYKLWADMIAHGVAKTVKERKHHVLYAGRKDHIPYAVPFDHVLSEHGELIVHNERISPVFSAALGNHGFLLRHGEITGLIKAAEAIQARG
jgi:hypothetical protein